MRDVADELAGVVRDTVPRLGAISEEQSATRGSGTWRRKEILGHLIDSAVNNHQRFVRAQLVERLEFPDYDGDTWVETQGYRDRPWQQLVELWAALNLHLTQVIARIPAERLATPCRIGSGAEVTLEFVARDYLKHMRHHLEQILDPDQSAGKTHPPFAQL